MIMCWIACTYSYLMFIFLIKYLPADIYVVDIISGLSSFGFLLQGPLAKHLSRHLTQILSYSLVLLTLLILLFFGPLLQNSLLLYSLTILFLKFFICLSFGTIYVVHLELFDSSFLNLSYGICNIVTRIVVLFEPILAELEGVTAQLLIMLTINSLALLCSLFLKRAANKQL